MKSLTSKRYLELKFEQYMEGDEEQRKAIAVEMEYFGFESKVKILEQMWQEREEAKYLDIGDDSDEVKEKELEAEAQNLEDISGVND